MIIFFFGPVLKAQITLIPDPEFEQFLVSEGIDTDGTVNGQVFTADISDETTLNISMLPFLQDLTGIQDFSSLEELLLYQVDVSQLDLSQNTLLWRLVLDDLSLDALDLSNNVNLTHLNLSLNSPSDLFSGAIDAIDLSQNVLLESVNIGDGFLEIDVSNNPNIDFIELKGSPVLLFVNLQNGNNEGIGFLDIQNNPSLQCIQVDDPVAVIEGTQPPYDGWFIDINPPEISDNCVLGIAENSTVVPLLSPNPVRNQLSIQSQVPLTRVVFYNLLSQPLLEVTSGFDSLDVTALPSGLLLLEVVSPQGRTMVKVVKE